MALKTVKEIAEICGMPPKNIHTYRSRGKIMIDKEGMIDTDNPVNVEFMQKYSKLNLSGQVKKPKKKTDIDKSGGKTSEPGQYPEVKKEKLKVKRQAPDPDLTEDHSNYRQQDIEFYRTSMELKQLQKAKLIEETNLLRLKSQQKSGELIPVKFVSELFQRYIRAITTSFYNMADNYTSDMCTKIGASRETLTEFRGKLKKEINKSVDIAKEEVKKELETLVKIQEIDE